MVVVALVVMVPAVVRVTASTAVARSVVVAVSVVEVAVLVTVGGADRSSTNRRRSAGGAGTRVETNNDNGHA